MKNEDYIGIKQVLLYYFYLSGKRYVYFNTLGKFILHFYKKTSDKGKEKLYYIRLPDEELEVGIMRYSGSLFKVESHPPYSLEDIAVYLTSEENIKELILKNKINEEEIINAMKDFFEEH